MEDCPSRAAAHPVMTPTFHHCTRRCLGCNRTGCVVPSCPRNRFEPGVRTDRWTELPASGDAKLAWRCRTCGHVGSEMA